VALREAGGLVVYVQNTFDAAAVATWSTFFEHFCSPVRRQRMIETFSPGAFGHAIWPDLDVLPQDLKVRKRRFGAFAPGSSDLHAILQEREIDTLIVTGTATQVCCESTARDAMMLNYKVFFIADGNATFNDDEHNATLSAMAHTFCDVIDSDTMIGMIERAGAAAKTEAATA
jgi:ureidoacrylate peracid hydrolase